MNVDQAWARHPQILPALCFLYPSLSVWGCVHVCVDACEFSCGGVCAGVHLNVGIRGEMLDVFLNDTPPYFGDVDSHYTCNSLIQLNWLSSEL